jgi:hypothetical protein
MSAEHDDAKKAARQEDFEAEAARQAAESSGCAIGCAARHATQRG